MLDFLGSLYWNMDETAGGGIGGRIQGAVCYYCWKNQADTIIMGHPTCQTCAKHADTTYSLNMGWGHLGGDIGFKGWEMGKKQNGNDDIDRDSI